VRRSRASQPVRGELVEHPDVYKICSHHSTLGQLSLAFAGPATPNLNSHAHRRPFMHLEMNQLVFAFMKQITLPHVLNTSASFTLNLAGNALLGRGQI